MNWWIILERLNFTPNYKIERDKEHEWPFWPIRLFFVLLSIVTIAIGISMVIVFHNSFSIYVLGMVMISCSEIIAFLIALLFSAIQTFIEYFYFSRKHKKQVTIKE